jgi:hypothetical protein
MLKWQSVAFTFQFYLGWIMLHYGASHLYIHLCVPNTLTGLLYSPFFVPAPHCTGLRWVINTGGNTISAMWVVAGLFLVNCIQAK